MATLADLITSIRAETDHDVDQQVTDTQLTLWINQEYYLIRREIGDLAPDLYTAVTADFTIANGASSQDLAGAPLSLTDFGKIRTVERKEGGFYVPLPVAPALMSGVLGYLAFRLRGTVLDFFPEVLAPGTYRVKYIIKPPVLSGSNTVFLPEGTERIVEEAVSARVRYRFEEEPTPHLEARSAYRREILDSLHKQYVSTPQGVVDVTGRY